jgi:uncharacterized Ntn-hydrolase superfamily protein
MRALLALMTCLGAVLFSAASAADVPPRGADADVAATFSIVAFDPEKKEWGVAVASKYLAVGAAVPFAKAGFGAIATQALVNVTYGFKGLELLEKGKSAAEVFEALAAEDKGKEFRQVAIIDAKGEVITFTGKKCNPWAGGKSGKHYSVQGNLLAGEKVIDAMAEAFEKSSGTLAWRLMSALEAGDRAGGDKRGKQSAAILVVRERGGPNGFGDRFVDFRVDDHKEPVDELARILVLRMRRPK